MRQNGPDERRFGPIPVPRKILNRVGLATALCGLIYAGYALCVHARFPSGEEVGVHLQELRSAPASEFSRRARRLIERVGALDAAGDLVRMQHSMFAMVDVAVERHLEREAFEALHAARLDGIGVDVDCTAQERLLEISRTARDLLRADPSLFTRVERCASVAFVSRRPAAFLEREDERTDGGPHGTVP